MITWFFGPQTSDGKKHETLDEAKAWELATLFCIEEPPSKENLLIAESIVKKCEQAVDILTMKPNSRPKARKIHGGTKPRKSKPEEKKDLL